MLFQGSAPSGSSDAAAGKSKETEATAELDTQGLLQLQNQVMRQQDTELEHMEKAITSTKVGNSTNMLYV